jgi:MFS transporter, MFS domain-containing protein family, molybdate-anion transporter
MLGAIQSLFEGAMYSFVFLWTPALSPNGESIPHGFIFACLLISCMPGAALAGMLMKRGSRPEKYLTVVLGVAAAMFVVPAICHSARPTANKGEGNHRDDARLCAA